MSNNLIGNLSNANFPTDAEGRVYHLGCKKGEIANRVLTVGDGGRAKAFGALPGFVKELEFTSPRNFTIITGTYKGKRISIVSSNMGYPNMDFTVRELRHCIDGPMAMVRFGTCGTPTQHIPVGDFVVATEGCVTIQRNPDAFNKNVPVEKRGEKYHFSAVIDGSVEFNLEIEKALKARVDPSRVYSGVKASADSFYSAQGRQDPNFNDDNAGVIDELVKRYPNCIALEMETSHLYDLANNCNIPIYAGGAALVLAQRRSNDFLSYEKKHECETIGGLACLDALANFMIPGVDC